jgi:hypothetical protein
LRALIARDLEDAAIQQLSDDRRFATAYNAALPTAKMAIVRLAVSSQAHLVIPLRASVRESYELFEPASTQKQLNELCGVA